jgi:hypothetical protein
MMADPAFPTRPFDVADLKPCALCRRGVMHGGDVAFYELVLGQCIVDMGAIGRLAGLEQMMGGAVGLARMFSPNNNIAHRLPPERHIICQPCLMDSEALATLLTRSDETARPRETAERDLAKHPDAGPG